MSDNIVDLSLKRCETAVTAKDAPLEGVLKMAIEEVRENEGDDKITAVLALALTEDGRAVYWAGGKPFEMKYQVLGFLEQVKNLVANNGY